MKTPILLITPPFTQLNTPYPATAYLKGFLNTKNIASTQVDLGIEVILRMFSEKGLIDIFDFATTNISSKSENSRRIFALKNRYIDIIDPVIAFLQGKNQTLALQICSNHFLPQASRFEYDTDFDLAFGNMGTQDQAKHLATLFLEDIADFIKECVDPNFGFSRYAERLGRSANSFDNLYAALNQDYSYIDKLTIQILQSKLNQVAPQLLLLSVPFPGNLFAAFRCAQYVKKNHPEIRISMGGGFPNTELRSISDPRVFEFLDYITLDDGELPVEHLITTAEKGIFKRTFLLENEAVIYKNNSERSDYKQFEVGTPDYTDLKLDQYISVIEIANPMHSMWSDGRWNKLTMAHGCYWGKCTFCDISLDYIKIYEPIAAKLIVDRVEELVQKTGGTGFHFVDEAAPPALMREVALELIRRKITITWWTNIRFEKNFSPDLCILLQKSGCIAVSGGLEVASDRLLKLIDKGVSVAQVAQVCNNFAQAKIMVHAYLMYGFPTQTVQETIDSLEMVRQMFELNVLKSAFWHQFAMTTHSPVGQFPAKFGVNKKTKQIGTFANNDIEFFDKTGIDHDKFSFGLKKSLHNYMHSNCIDLELKEWFDFKTPKTSIDNRFIWNALMTQTPVAIKPTTKIIWFGNQPQIEHFIKTKKANSWAMLRLQFHDVSKKISIEVNENHGLWLLKTLENIHINQQKNQTFQTLKQDYENQFDDFELFWQSKPIQNLRKIGLLQL